MWRTACIEQFGWQRMRPIEYRISCACISKFVDATDIYLYTMQDYRVLALQAPLAKYQSTKPKQTLTIAG